MKNSQQKQYFEMAYKTGSDVWTHIPYQDIAQSMLPKLESDSLVLDIGAGRGLWLLRLVELGYRVLGIDYVDDIVEKANEKIKNRNISDRARFVFGDALDIPFINEGFDLVTDIGTFQHIYKEDWPLYAKEVARVLAPGDYYFNVSFSRRTPSFMGWKPNINSPDGSFEKFELFYYFFTRKEIENIFSSDFDIVEQKVEMFDLQKNKGDQIVLLFSLLRKK